MADKTDLETNKIQTAQPGAVISPGAAAPAQPESQPNPPPESEAQPEPNPQPLTDTEPESVASDEVPVPKVDDAESISWTASEFVAHDKSAGWYFMLAICAALIAAGAYFVTRDYVSVGVVFAAAVLFGFYGSHKPRQLEYRLTHQGIDIDKKHYNFSNYRTFSVIPEGAFSSIVLMPLKRFAIPLSLYFAPEDEEKITDMLSSILPFEERRRDAVDSLMHRIRF